MDDAQNGPSDIYVCARVLSVDPLVTISTIGKDYPAGIASIAADLFEGRRGLHLLHPNWTIDDGYARVIMTGVEQASRALPNSEFLLLASDAREMLAFNAAGGRSVLGNGLIMADERIWYPRVSSGSRFAAVYNARLEQEKRHKLANSISSLLLIYGHPVDTESETALRRVRAILPNATFANNDMNAGAYRLYPSDEVAGLLARCDVGLCLSAVEGCMRATMEYLLCGLPVVSTRSVGGRDRYLGAGYCRIVEDDPDAIAKAVAEYGSLQLDRHRIREHVGQILAFERHNLLLDLNALVRRQFGLSVDLFRDIMPFIGAVAHYAKLGEVRTRIADQFASALS